MHRKKVHSHVVAQLDSKLRNNIIQHLTVPTFQQSSAA